MKIAVIKGKGTIAPHVMEGFIDAFKILGHTVFVFDFSRDDLLVQFNSLRAFGPELAVGYGSTALLKANDEFYFRKNGVVCVLLHYDAPCFVLNDAQRAEVKENRDYYLHMVWDGYFLDLLRKDGIANLHPIKLAVNPSIFYADGETQATGGIAFVGNLVVAPPSTATLPAAPFALPPELRSDFIDLIIARKIRHIGLPVLDVIRAAIEDPKYADIGTAYAENERQFWYDYVAVHTRGSFEIRKTYIDAVLDKPLDLYADSDPGLPGITFKGPVDYRRGLRKVYASHAINLNISSLQLETSANNRVFDCFASGGFLLSDYKADMREIFPDFWEAITFDGIPRMNEMIAHYRGNDAERRELIGRARDIVINGHTYQHRAASILDVVS